MKTAKATKAGDLHGQYVRGADGRVYQVTMLGTTTAPWGRVANGEVAEIPRPFRECEVSKGKDGK